MTTGHQPLFIFLRGLAGGLGVLLSVQAHALLGPFELGSGIKSLSMGGIAYVGASETTALSANPALTLSLGKRLDVGADLVRIQPSTTIEGNALGADEKYDSRRVWALIPQVGYSAPLNDNWAWGVTALQAGFGPKYKRSPYTRFGGAEQASLRFGSASLATALAWRPVAAHQFGAGLMLGYQFFTAKGLQFLASDDPQFQVSESPDNVTDQQKDDAFSLGFTLGWIGQISEQVSLGAGYRSKSWAQKMKKYQGLLPEGGRLELPASYGLGLAWQINSKFGLALEWQRVDYSSVKAFSNPLSQLSEGNPLGSNQGPGFGFTEHQDVYKVGLEWHYSPSLTLRLGYADADQVIQASDTFFAGMAPTVTTAHYTAGFTYQQDETELTLALMHCPPEAIRGESAIPASLGGGNVSLSNGEDSFSFSLGLSVAKKF